MILVNNYVLVKFYGTVGGDQGQINAQRIVQSHDILLQEDLDELHEDCNDQNEHDGLQIAQTGGVQNMVVDDYGADVAALGFGAAYIEALVCAVGAGVGFMLQLVVIRGR